MELSVNRLLAENTGGSSTSKVILQSGLSCISAFVEANMHHTPIGSSGVAEIQSSRHSIRTRWTAPNSRNVNTTYEHLDGTKQALYTGRSPS